MQVRAVVTFHIPDRTVVEGDEFDSTDPIVDGRRGLFEPVNQLESAEALPGEKRSTKRPKSP